QERACEWVDIRGRSTLISTQAGTRQSWTAPSSSTARRAREEKRLFRRTVGRRPGADAAGRLRASASASPGLPTASVCPGSSIPPDVRRSPIKKETTMKIVTSLSFQGQCREAFEFYAKVLGGKITAAMPYSDAPPGMPITDEKYKSWLMHCWLEVGDQALMGADMDVGWARNIDKPKNGFNHPFHTNH